LARKTGLSEKGIEWNIKKLKDIGTLKRIGPPRNGHWEIVQKPETLQPMGKEPFR
jgi:ATP-dependent DNA helicase RecG